VGNRNCASPVKISASLVYGSHRRMRTADPHSATPNRHVAAVAKRVRSAECGALFELPPLGHVDELAQHVCSLLQVILAEADTTGQCSEW
jgi:hypothetical protein